MATLYRKHRPQTFAEMIGQNHIRITLQHEISAGQIAHAYLFCGPRGVGKTTMARLFAKSLNCLNRKDGEFEPCDICDNCIEIKEGRSLDMIEVDAASHTGVDNVRENIIASSRISPGKSKHKVFIIDEVHMLSISAFNALLKVLEEPSPNVIFILCTTEVHKVPSTIISRCQRFDFRKIGVREMVQKLEHITTKEGIKIDTQTLEEIARYSEGHLRDAESLLGQILAIGGKEISRDEAALVIPRSDFNEVLNLLELIDKKDAAGGIRLVNSLLNDGVELKSFINNLVEITRKTLMIKINPVLADNVSMEYGEAIESKIRKLSAGLSQEQLISIIHEFTDAKLKLKDAYIVQLPLEIAIVSLCSTESSSVPISRNNEKKNNGQNQDNGPAATAGGDSEAGRSELATDNSFAIKWQQVMEKIKKYNHSISFILGVCKPRSMKTGKLCLAFKYKFHRDRLNNPGIRTTVEKAISEIFGRPVNVETVIDESLEIEILDNDAAEISKHTEEKIIAEENARITETGKNDSANQDLISDLLRTFGGKVIQ